MLTKIETAFQKAICKDTIPPGQSMVCGCGQTYLNTEEPLYYGNFQGMIIVAGCECQASSAFAGLLWGHRHPIADFFREMLAVLEADLIQLRGELPAAVGTQPEGAQP